MAGKEKFGKISDDRLSEIVIQNSADRYNHVDFELKTQGKELTMIKDQLRKF